jgi:hypothetical protein
MFCMSAVYSFAFGAETAVVRAARTTVLSKAMRVVDEETRKQVRDHW